MLPDNKKWDLGRVYPVKEMSKEETMRMIKEDTAKRYSKFDVKKAWDKYQHHRVLRVLKDGKWHIQTLEPVTRIDGTRAEVVKISSVLSFPKYLEKYCGS